MQRFLLFLTLLSFVLLTTNCNKEEETIAGRANLRIENLSTYDYQDVYINSNGVEHNFGDVAAGRKTSFTDFERIYMKAEVRLLINGDTFRFDPIDYVGQVNLLDGKFIYQIDVVDFDNKVLSLQFDND